MNTRRKLNCYVFGNLIVSFLTMNLITNPTSRVLVEKNSNTSLNKIYEKENLIISTPDTIISSENKSNVIRISNNVSTNNSYKYNYVKPSYNSVTGTNLVNYAKNFIGLRYVHAGDSLATGTDCSGFTRLIYKEFGISLGRTVSSQLYSGSYVSRDDLQPGDLVFYSYGSVASHVAIYMGNGLIIHQSTPKDGVKISSVNIMRYITARRVITSNVVVKSEVKTEVKDIKQEEKSVEKDKIENDNAVEKINNNNDVENKIEEQNKDIKESNIDKKNNIKESNVDTNDNIKETVKEEVSIEKEIPKVEEKINDTKIDNVNEVSKIVDNELENKEKIKESE